jgi:hypothetical protein
MALFDSPLLNMATPYTNAAESLVYAQKNARLKEEAQQQEAIKQDLNNKRNLLADPGKVDNMVSSNLEDIYPFVKKPKVSGETDKTSAIDESLRKADHPLAGAASAIKSQFKQALSDPQYAGVDPLQLLDAVKKQHLGTQDASGKTLADRMHDYKYEKDRGTLHFNPFTENAGDKNTLAMPGYEEYKQSKDIKEGPYHTNATEALAWGAIEGVIAGVLTGGGSIATNIGRKVLTHAALAVPEFKAFDYVANKVATSGDPMQPRGLTDLTGELIVGGLGMAITHKVITRGTGFAISKAIEAGKVSENAVNMLGKTGLASDAVEAFKAGKFAERATADASRVATLEKELLTVKSAENFKNLSTKEAEATARARVGVGATPGEFSDVAGVMDVNKELMGERLATAGDLKEVGVPGRIKKGTTESFYGERQKTDKKGNPLFQDAEGNITTEAAGNIPAIGNYRADFVPGKTSQGAKDMLEFLKTMEDEAKTPLINPDYLKANKIGWESTDLVHSNPSAAVFTRISPEAEAMAFKDMEAGVPAQKALTTRFMQDNAIKNQMHVTVDDAAAKAVDMEAMRLKAAKEVTPALDQSFTGPASRIPATKNEEGLLRNLGYMSNDIAAMKPQEVATTIAQGIRKSVAPAMESSHYLGGAAGIITTGLIGAGVTFGTPQKSEASPLTAVAEVAGKEMPTLWKTVKESVGAGAKKLLDGAVHLKEDVLKPAVNNVSNPVIKAALEKDVLRSSGTTASEELINKAKGRGLFTTTGSSLIQTIVKASPKDGNEVLKTLSEMGIDTEKRIVYHGTNSSSASMTEYDPAFAKSGIFNDPGEFAKHGASLPEVANGYGGAGAEFRFRKGASVEDLQQDLYRLKAQGKTNLSANIIDQLVDVAYKNTPTEAAATYAKTFEFYPVSGLLKEHPEVFEKYFQTEASNVQKLLFDTKKTFVMQGKPDKEVLDLLNKSGYFVNDFKDNKEVWETLGDFGRNKLLDNAKSDIDKLFLKSAPDFVKNNWSTDQKLNFLRAQISRDYISADGKVKVLENAGLTQVDAEAIDAISTRLLENNTKSTANNILRDLGYDSITHLGREDSLVTIALKPSVIKSFWDGNVIAINVFKTVTGISGTTALASLFSANSAEASPITAGAKIIPEAVKLAAESGGILKKGEELLKAIFDNHWYAEAPKEGQLYIARNNLMDQLITAPVLGRGIKAAKDVMGRTSTFVDGISKLMSNAAFSDLYGTITHSAANQLASMQSAVSTNSLHGLRIAENIAKTVPGLMEDYGKTSKEIAAYMKPLQESYDNFAIPLAKTEFEIKNTETVINNLTKQLKEDGADVVNLNNMIKEQTGKLQSLKDLNSQYAGSEFTSAKDALVKGQEELAKKYSATRIALAAEDTADFVKYPFMRNIPMTFDEKAAVGLYKDMMNNYKVRSVDAGMDVINGPYIRHSRDNTKVSEEFAKQLEGLGIQVNKNIPLTSFLSRTKYSQQMIPDILRNVSEYIPDAEKRINVSNFWKVGKDGGWDAVAKNPEIKSNKVWNDFFDRVRNAHNPAPDTAFNRFADRYASVETLRLLAFLPSAPFKHLFKNEGTWATLGFTNSMRHIPEAFVTATRLAVNNGIDRLGLSTAKIPKGAMDDFVQSVMKQRNLINALSDVERHEGTVSLVDKWLDNVTSKGSIGIQAVEAFDRVHTITAAFDMSLKKGMTAEQAMSGIYATILKNNFLGGALNPEWMHNPKIRMLALFQNTPFKILERRIVNGIKTGEDVKTAFGIIRKQNLDATLADLQNIKLSVLEGQNELKKSMIYEALTANKDSFGNSISAQFVREWMIAGLITSGGTALGVNLSKHSFHLPFVKDDKNGMVFATSPAVDATWKTIHGGGYDQNVPTDDKEFFPTRFYKNWLQSSGGAQPLVLHKMQRITNADIPAIYKDSAFKYLFSVPSSED